MAQYMDKSAVVAVIEKRKNICKKVVWDLRTQENKDYYQGKAEAYKEVLDLLDTLEVKEVQEEPVSDDLEEASEEYAYTNWQSDDYHDGAAEGLPFDAIGHTQKTFKAGAKWQTDQFEKERLKLCDNLTKEQAKIEQDFVVNFIKNNNCTPTFIDAIEYGKKLKLKDKK